VVLLPPLLLALGLLAPEEVVGGAEPRSADNLRGAEKGEGEPGISSGGASSPGLAPGEEEGAEPPESAEFADDAGPRGAGLAPDVPNPDSKGADAALCVRVIGMEMFGLGLCGFGREAAPGEDEDEARLSA
jgi:hypothetical protein